MAADVLACRPTHLAVGLDQLRHLEHIKLVGRRLNLLAQRAFGEKCVLFPEVGAVAASKLKLMCLRVPTQKMSKSMSPAASTINVLDGYDVLKLKLVRAHTDCCDSLPAAGPLLRNRLGVASLLRLYAAVAAAAAESAVMVCVQNVKMQQFKAWLAKLVYAKLRKTRRLTVGLLAAPEAVDAEVAKGNAAVES